MQPSEETILILYIVGAGRSGSTLLGNALGSIPGFVHLGEMRFILDRGVLENRLCACGRSFKDCEFWRVTMQALSLDLDQKKAHDLVELRERYSRSIHLPLLLIKPLRETLIRRLQPYLLFLKEVYSEVARQEDARVLVDTSKFPTYGYLLQQIPGFDVRFINLVRDPRAVAYSWKSKKIQPDPNDELVIRRYGPAASSIRWLMWNLAAKAIWRGPKYQRAIIRYEDFVEDPQNVLKRIVALTDLEVRSLPVTDNDTVFVKPGHDIWGNPTRFMDGEIKLERDVRYLDDQSSKDKLVATLFSLPLLKAYGYPVIFR